MAAFTRLAQFKHRAAGNDFATMAEECLEELFQVQHARLAVDQRHHIHAEAVLHLRVFPQIVKDNFRHFAALEFDDRAHARLVGLVADVGNAFKPLLAHQFADFHQQIGLVDLIRQLVDDDGNTAALFRFFEMGARAHDHAAAAGAIAVAHAGHAVDDACGREIRCRHDRDQLIDGDFGVFQQCLTGIDHFAEIVRRDVGRHAHGNA